MIRRRTSRIALLVCAVCLFACLFACRSEVGITTLKLAHSLDVRHPVHRALVYLANDVAERSGGRLRVTIYPSEQLGSERECIELLQIGSLAMTKTSAAVLASFVPAYDVLGLPFLFRDKAHAFAVLDGAVGRDLLRTSEPSRLRGLAFYDAGSRSFYTRDRAVHTPEDLAGLKIRTQESAMAMAMVEALGGAPTPISWGELYTALEQGVVDGAENNPPSFHLSRHYEVARHYVLDEHTMVPDVLLVSSDAWGRLTEEQRRWLQSAADASAVEQRRLWGLASEEALAAVEVAGVEVIRPDKRLFQARVGSLLSGARDNPALAPWIDRIREQEAVH